MIRIDENYYIDADTKCYTLKEKGIKKSEDGTESEIFKDLGYYTTLEGCLYGLIKKETRKYIKNTNEATVSDLSNKIKELEKYFRDKFGDI